MDAMRAADVAMASVWTAWWLSWMAAAAWSDRAASRPPRGQQIGYRLLVSAGVGLLFGLFRHDFRSEVILWRTPPVAAWALVALACVGFGFTWWARIHLGRLWSSSVTRKAAHHIVDTGPYALVRHPIYTGVTLAAIATAALRGTATGWAGLVVLTIGWVVKARLEEGFLRAQLGAETYDAYARRVPMLVPFLR